MNHYYSHIVSFGSLNEMILIFKFLFITLVYCKFTIVIIPDSQYYAAYYPDILHAQFDWICNCQQSLNIAFASHVGDLIENGNHNELEWLNAYDAINGIQNNGICSIPFGFTNGNHDISLSDDVPFDLYDVYFGSDSDWIITGSFPNGTMRNSFTIFTTLDGEQFLFMHLQSDVSSPSNGSLIWADSILTQYSNITAFLTSHWILDDCSDYYSPEVSTLMFNHCNVKMSFGGHVFQCGGENSLELTNKCGQKVFLFTSDYQGRHRGGSGWLRYYEISSGNETDLTCTYTYNPVENNFELDNNSYFSISNGTFGSGCSLNDVCTISFTPRGFILTVLWIDSICLLGFIVIWIEKLKINT